METKQLSGQKGKQILNLNMKQLSIISNLLNDSHQEKKEIHL